MQQDDRFSSFWLVALTVLLVLALLASLVINFGPLFLTAGDAPSLLAWTRNAALVPTAPFTQLPSFIASAAALLALLTYRRDRKKWEQERTRHQSEFFFRQASTGLDEVLPLLRDGNNDRVIWVRAARSLLQAQALAKDIQLPEFQRAYRLYEQRIRNDLYLVLTVRDPSTGLRQPLPPQFFYGVPDWTARKPLDEVAIQRSHTIEAYHVSLDALPPQPRLQPLSTHSVVAIFDFLDFPKDYDDPLKEVKVWTGDWTSVHGEKMGAARYLAHRESKVAIGGQLHDRKKGDQP